jgi:AcrR family transcriptional regulator
MASPRRIGTEDSKTRAALLDAAERVMVEDGYAAATSRRVAARAGLKPGLVHYYFRTMDDLFIALFRRRAEQGLEKQAKALASAQPLWSMWELAADRLNTTLMMELMALANHRKRLKAEIAAHSERSRGFQIEAASGLVERYGFADDPNAAVTIMVLMSSISLLLTIEDTFGIARGHAEAIALVERYLHDLEGERRPPDLG